MDVSVIKIALFKNTYSMCGAGLQPGISPLVSFSRIFSFRNTYFQEHLRVFFILSFFFDFDVSYSLCFYLFLQKIRRNVPFSTSWLLLIAIDKFANRYNCGYCFRRSGKFPQERLHWSSQQSCCLPTWCLLIVLDQNFPQIFRT